MVALPEHKLVGRVPCHKVSELVDNGHPTLDLVLYCSSQSSKMPKNDFCGIRGCSEIRFSILHFVGFLDVFARGLNLFQAQI
jgi:hypothetical protein